MKILRTSQARSRAMKTLKNACLLLLIAVTVASNTAQAGRSHRRRAKRGSLAVSPSMVYMPGPSSMAMSPSMIGYYPGPPSYPPPPNYLDPVAVGNPNAVPIRCVIDGRLAEIPPGQVLQLGVGRKWHIEFDRGAGLGTVRYTMRHGLHQFVLTGHGWDLRRRPSGVTQPVSGPMGYGPPPNPLSP